MIPPVRCPEFRNQGGVVTRAGDREKGAVCVQQDSVHNSVNRLNTPKLCTMVNMATF